MLSYTFHVHTINHTIYKGPQLLSIYALTVHICKICCCYEVTVYTFQTLTKHLVQNLPQSYKRPRLTQ